MADNTLHTSARRHWLERRFALHSRGGSLRTECLAGITGFLAAAYLLVVIPGLLAIGGMDKGAATTGTILVFVAGSLLMAFYANLPFIVGPGIGGSVLVGVTLAGSGRYWLADWPRDCLLVGDPLLPVDPIRPARSGHPLGTAIN